MYWKNAGQSGYPTTIEWEADGVELGPLQFPIPKAYEFLDMIIYVHEGEFVLLTEINVDDDFEADKLEIRGKLSTLICNEENCIPYETDLALDIHWRRPAVFLQKNPRSSPKPKNSGQPKLLETQNFLPCSRPGLPIFKLLIPVCPI
jgi:DsbC/DsbD-like thiol-disulfide interchange protein